MENIHFDFAATLVQGLNWFINGLFMSFAWVIGSATARKLGGLFSRDRHTGKDRYGR